MLLRTVAVATLLLFQPQSSRPMDFPASTKSAEARARFMSGLAWLHNFGYDEATEEFRKAQSIDPTFAMAYWGEAMCHYRPVWRIENLEAARAVLGRFATSREERASKAATAHERAYLAAAEAVFDSTRDQTARHTAFVEAMQKIVTEHPEDVDASVFLAFALVGTVPVGVYDDARLDRAGAAAERAFRLNPKHPGAAHAVIHSYDDRERASRALPAARVYAKLAKESSHARHMPAHVFVQLGMWEEAVASDEAAWAAAIVHAKHRGQSAAERDYHPLSWLVYEYMQQGRFDRAREALRPLEEAIAQDPRPPLKNELATWRAYYVVGSGRWSEVANQQGFDNADELFALGFAAARTNDLPKAKTTLDIMKKVAATDPIPSRRELAAIMERQLTAAVAARSGNRVAALEAGHAAAALEDKTPRSTGRPHPVKSSHELYGELLLDAGQATAARAQFERALWRATNRSSSVLGAARASTVMGDAAAARRHYEQFLRNWKQADSTRPELAEARAALGVK